VLIHGFLSNHHTYDDVTPLLAQSFHVVSIDLPGAGDSARPPPSQFDYSIEALAEVATDVIAALQVGRCHVVGCGSGASIAIALAAEHPEFVDHLALVSPDFFPGRPPPLVRLMQIPLAGALLYKQVIGRSLFHSLFLRHMYAPSHTIPTDRINLYYDCQLEPAARESTVATLHAQRDTRPTIARLSRIKSQTLVLWGRSDHRVSVEVAPRFVRQLRDARLVYIDSGPSPQEEVPDLFVAALEPFLLNQQR